jgi:hypothetical protein
MHFAPLPYLDPGSGSFLIQLLIATLLGAGVFIGASWNKIKKLFGIKPKTDGESTDDEDDEPDAK